MRTSPARRVEIWRQYRLLPCVIPPPYLSSTIKRSRDTRTRELWFIGKAPLLESAGASDFSSMAPLPVTEVYQRPSRSPSVCVPPSVRVCGPGRGCPPAPDRELGHCELRLPASGTARNRFVLFIRRQRRGWRHSSSQGQRRHTPLYLTEGGMPVGIEHYHKLGDRKHRTEPLWNMGLLINTMHV